MQICTPHAHKFHDFYFQVVGTFINTMTRYFDAAFMLQNYLVRLFQYVENKYRF